VESVEDVTAFDVLGEAFFVRLVDDFYAVVDTDPILRPMYPADLTDAKKHLVLFLIQYFGGPATYMDVRGHPRLRMRHAEFRITKKARDAWLTAMTTALAQQRETIPPAIFDDMTEYFEMAAHQLRNV
jgi:hemoglobin